MMRLLEPSSCLLLEDQPAPEPPSAVKRVLGLDLANISDDLRKRFKIKDTVKGVVITGGKQLSTAAPHSHEVYVALSATFAQRNDPRCVLAFAIPNDTPGLKILAREPVSRWFGSWGHPLKMLDEQDCMLFFDHVLVPWDRLFMLYDPTPMVRILGADGASVIPAAARWPP